MTRLEVRSTVLAGELAMGRQKEKSKWITESCSLSRGQMLLPFSETGKTRKEATCVRQEGSKHSVWQG